jgi:hypothetical protein
MSDQSRCARNGLIEDLGHGPTDSDHSATRFHVPVVYFGLGSTGGAPCDDCCRFVSIPVVDVDLHQRQLAHPAHELGPFNLHPGHSTGHGLQGGRMRICRIGICVAGGRAAASPRGMVAPADRDTFVEQTITLGPLRSNQNITPTRLLPPTSSSPGSPRSGASSPKTKSTGIALPQSVKYPNSAAGGHLRRFLQIPVPARPALPECKFLKK